LGVVTAIDSQGVRVSEDKEYNGDVGYFNRSIAKMRSIPKDGEIHWSF